MLSDPWVAIVRASEALEDGDAVFAADLLRITLEERKPLARRYRCECGFDAEWPGLLDRHKIDCEHTASEILKLAA